MGEEVGVSYSHVSHVMQDDFPWGGSLRHCHQFRVFSLWDSIPRSQLGGPWLNCSADKFSFGFGSHASAWSSRKTNVWVPSLHLSWREKMGILPTWDLWSMSSHQTADYTGPAEGGLNHFCQFHKLTEMSGCAILSTRRGDGVRLG